MRSMEIKKAGGSRSTPGATIRSGAVTASEMVALRKLTGRVLENLKNPNATPSEIILAALLEARSIK